MSSEKKRAQLGAETLDTLRPDWVAGVDQESLSESRDFIIVLLNQVFGSRKTAILEFGTTCTGYTSTNHMLRALGLEVYHRRGQSEELERNLLKSEWLSLIELRTRTIA